MHRDLKPENIIFQNNDDIKIQIVDFGFSTKLKEYKKLFKSCGTPGYIAPEILHDKDYGLNVDIYSAGVIFYIILTGRMAFRGNSLKKILKNNLKGKINFDFSQYEIDVSEETMDLLKRMLEFNPKKRVSAEQALAHPCFEKIMSKSPLVVRSFYQAQDLMDYDNAVKAGKEINSKFNNMPLKAEDLSPLPNQDLQKSNYFTK